MVRTSTRTSSVRGKSVGIFLIPIFGLLLLSSLHLVQGQDGEGADVKLLGDRMCFKCHQDMRESFALSIHGPLGGAEDSTACESCHGPGREHMGSGGEVEFIVRFGELSPTEAATRCLTCHDKTEGGGHLVGYLDSKWMAEGKSCLDCHAAHGPAHAMASPTPAASEPMTAAECLVCHSDRKEMVAFSHLERTADLRGCETCHGSGREHALSRGASGTIVDLRDAPIKRADASCLLCHQDMQAPEHFKPTPGKERCVDCHGIHIPSPLPSPVAAATPGRPEFKLDTADAGQVEEIPPFRPSPLPVAGGEGYDFIGMNFTGDIRLGYRFTNVDGSETVYEQRQDYQSGVRLFDLSLGGKALDDSGAEFFLSATGVGDPVANYRMNITDGRNFEFSIDGQRRDLHYGAIGDPWKWGAKTDLWGFELTLFPKAPIQVTLGYDHDYTDGDRLGTRLIGGSITPTDEPFKETANNAWIRIDWDAGPVNMSLSQAYRWEDLTDEIYGGVDAGTAFAQRIDTDYTAPLTTFMATAKASQQVIFDTKIVYSPTDSDSTVRSNTIAVGPGGDATRPAVEQVNGGRNLFRGELGATWFATSDLRFLGRVAYSSSNQDMDGVNIQGRLGDPTGSNGINREMVDTTRDQDRWRFFVEGDWRPVEWGAFRLGYEWMIDDVRINVDERDYDEKSLTQGPVVGVDLDPLKELSINLLYRFMRNDNVMTEIGTQDKDQARLKIRWTPEDNLFFTAFGTQQYITNTRHDTEILSWAAGFTAHFEPLDGLTFEGTYDYRYYDTETDVVRFIDGLATYGVSAFAARTSGISFFAGWDATDALHLEAGGYWGLSNGDYPVDVVNLWIGAEYEFVERMSVGVDFRYNSYEEKDTSANDYDAYIWELWLRYRF